MGEMTSCVTFEASFGSAASSCGSLLAGRFNSIKMSHTRIRTRGFLLVGVEQWFLRWFVYFENFFAMEPASNKRKFSPVWEHFDLISPNKVQITD